MSKYQRTIKGQAVDVYDVLVAWEVTCPATAHAIKKLLMPGKRGSKGAVHDLKEAHASIARAIELTEGKGIDMPENPTPLVTKGTIWEAEDGTTLEFTGNVTSPWAELRYVARVNGEFLHSWDAFPYSKFFAKMPLGSGPYALLPSVKVRRAHETA